MVDEETVNETTPYRFEDPADEYERAKSDYLYISGSYKNFYAVVGYIEAEEKAWKRLEEAHQNLIDSSKKS